MRPKYTNVRARSRTPARGPEVDHSTGQALNVFARLSFLIFLAYAYCGPALTARS
jgi:hypothetical protein